MISLQLDFKPAIKDIHFYTKRMSLSEALGEELSKAALKGIEFEEYKPFVFGDDAHMIDWKASLRSRRLLIKKTSQTKSASIFILLDVSNSMLFSSNKKLKCEYAAELAAALSYFFLQNSMAVGIGFCSDGLKAHIPPAIGKKAYHRITGMLSNPALYGGGFDLSMALKSLPRFLPKNTTILLISDFIHLDSSWKQSIAAAASLYDLRCFMIKDPTDLSLNDRIGRMVLEDPYSDQTLMVDLDAIKESYAKNAKSQQDEVMTSLKKSKVDSLLLLTDREFIKSVMLFLGRKTWT